MPEGAIAVTGSSRGIGAAIARELAARGLTVGCLSRGGGLPDGAEASEKFIPAQCDVTDEASIHDALAAVADKAGGLAGVVNNAGIHRETRSRDLTTDDYAEIMETNATSVMIVSREAYPHLEKNGGRIVNIGSFYDKLGVPRTLAYCASKAAVAAMTRCLAAEWAKAGISVVNVAPGFIETDLNREIVTEEKFQTWLNGRSPVRRPGATDEIARIVASLFTEDVAFLTGETIYVDGGQGMAL